MPHRKNPQQSQKKVSPPQKVFLEKATPISTKYFVYDPFSFLALYKTLFIRTRMNPKLLIIFFPQHTQYKSILLGEI